VQDELDILVRNNLLWQRRTLPCLPSLRPKAGAGRGTRKALNLSSYAMMHICPFTTQKTTSWVAARPVVVILILGKEGKEGWDYDSWTFPKSFPTFTPFTFHLIRFSDSHEWHFGLVFPDSERISLFQICHCN